MFLWSHHVHLIRTSLLRLFMEVFCIHHSLSLLSLTLILHFRILELNNNSLLFFLSQSPILTTTTIVEPEPFRALLLIGKSTTTDPNSSRKNQSRPLLVPKKRQNLSKFRGSGTILWSRIQLSAIEDQSWTDQNRSLIRQEPHRKVWWSNRPTGWGLIRRISQGLFLRFCLHHHQVISEILTTTATSIWTVTVSLQQKMRRLLSFQVRLCLLYLHRRAVCLCPLFLSGQS